MSSCETSSNSNKKRKLNITTKQQQIDCTNLNYATKQQLFYHIHKHSYNKKYKLGYWDMKKYTDKMYEDIKGNQNIYQVGNLPISTKKSIYYHINKQIDNVIDMVVKKKGKTYTWRDIKKITDNFYEKARDFNVIIF